MGSLSSRPSCGSPWRRLGRIALVLSLLACALALARMAPTAGAHAVLTSASPAPEAAVAIPPARVALRFSEPVSLLRAADLGVVDSEGAPVIAGRGRRRPDEAKAVEAPLRPRLPDGTYTVRYTVLSADSHVIAGAFAFAVGPGPVGEPLPDGASGGQGPSETGPWGVSARFLELVGLGGLLGLIAFRWLVWRPVWRRSLGLAGGEEDAALAWGRDLFWVAFGVLAVGSVVAEAYLLLTKSASLLGTSVPGALGDPDGMARTLADSRFGSLVQLRAALLFALFAIGIRQFLAEYGSKRSPRPPSVAGRALPAALMAALVLVALGSISFQGHASQAPASWASIAADGLHLSAGSTWIGGLAFTVLTLLRVPRVAPIGGSTLGASVLARFSQVALAAAALAVTTGVLRLVAELSDPAQLWETAYGRSVVYKLLLLAPIGFLALRNRRIVRALRRVRIPNRPTLRMVTRSAGLELALSVAIVVVASLLVAQVPGRMDG